MGRELDMRQHAPVTTVLGSFVRSVVQRGRRRRGGGGRRGRPSVCVGVDRPVKGQSVLVLEKSFFSDNLPGADFRFGSETRFQAQMFGSFPLVAHLRLDTPQS